MMGRKQLNRARRVLYCASDLDNKQLVELIENGSVQTSECARCIELQSELDSCAQQKARPEIDVHKNENKSAQKFVPNYEKKGIDLAALQSIAAGKTEKKAIEPISHVLPGQPFPIDIKYTNEAVTLKNKIEDLRPDVSTLVYDLINVLPHLQGSALNAFKQTVSGWIAQANNL